MGYTTLLITVFSLAMLALLGILLSGRKHWKRRITKIVRDASGVIAGAAAGALILGSLPAVMVITVAGEVDDRYTMWLLAAIGAAAGATIAGTGSWLVRRRSRNSPGRIAAS